MKGILGYLKSEIVLVVAAVAALISSLFVPPTLAYLQYLDFKVLALLFCLMAVITGLGRVGLFQVVSQSLLRRAANTRILALVLVMLCFFSAMLITNDVALLTFVPLTLVVFSLTEQKTLVYVIVLQTAAANLGSMLTPIGNPQNLYLYAFYQMDMGDFIRLTLPLTVLSFFLLLGSGCFVKARAIELQFSDRAKISSKRQLALFTGLFLLCLLTVLGRLHYLVTTFLVVISLLITNHFLEKYFRKCLTERRWHDIINRLSRNA